MKYINPLQPYTLFFLHIPKTAGSTVGHILSNWYGEELARVSSDQRETIEWFRALSHEEIVRISAVYGHYLLSDNFHSILPTEHQFGYFTMLRDPVERLLSGYYYIKNNPDHPYHHQVNRKSLEESVAFLEPPNQQVKMISGLPEEVVDSDASLAFDLAKRNLETYFLLVGTVERFDEVMIILRRMLGLPSPLYIKQNVGKRPLKNDISDAVLDQLREQNHLDYQLYNWADNLIQSKTDDETEREVSELRFWKTLSQRNSELERQCVETQESARQLASKNLVLDKAVLDLEHRLTEATQSLKVGQQENSDLRKLITGIRKDRLDCAQKNRELREKNKSIRSRVKALQAKIQEKQFLLLEQRTIKASLKNLLKAIRFKVRQPSSILHDE